MSKLGKNETFVVTCIHEGSDEHLDYKEKLNHFINVPLPCSSEDRNDDNHLYHLRIISSLEEAENLKLYMDEQKPEAELRVIPEFPKFAEFADTLSQTTF